MTDDSPEIRRVARQKVKREYGPLFATVSAALANADPMGLIIDGAPPDEYEPEVGAVLPRLREACCAHDIEQILWEEFDRSLAGLARIQGGRRLTAAGPYGGHRANGVTHVPYRPPVGVTEHGNSAVLVTVALGGELLDRRASQSRHGASITLGEADRHGTRCRGTSHCDHLRRNPSSAS
jgi:hypothetical protein